MSEGETASQPTERQTELIGQLVGWIRDRGLAAPAVLLLETSKPLLPIGGQALYLLQPLLGQIGAAFRWGEKGDRLGEYAALLDDPDAVDRILSHLERGPVE